MRRRGARAVEESEVLGIKGGALMDLCREDVGLGFELHRVLTQVIAARLIAAIAVARHICLALPFLSVAKNACSLGNNNCLSANRTKVELLAVGRENGVRQELSSVLW